MIYLMHLTFRIEFTEVVEAKHHGAAKPDFVEMAVWRKSLTVISSEINTILSSGHCNGGLMELYTLEVCGHYLPVLSVPLWTVSPVFAPPWII